MHAAERVAGLVVLKFRDAADGLPTQGGMAVFAGNVQGGAVRIAGNWFLRSTLRPLGMSLERTKKQSDLYESFSEHGTTYLGAAGLDSD